MRLLNDKQRGFTLIEMSIVLIIIGLIIGGILKGQELIESARQKNVISQVDQIRAGVNTFFDNYKALPGDYNQATARIHASLGDGNNDGTVGGLATNVTGLIAVNGMTASAENREFFNHLVGANLLGGASLVPPTTALTAFAGNGVLSPLPGSAYPRSGLTVAYGIHEGAATDGSPKQTAWLRMHTWVAGAVTGSQAAISPQRAFQMDSKYDDTLPYAGKIRTDYQVATGAAANSCGARTATGTGYGATETQTACLMYFDAIN
jgi:prepilin-type N-terminal cleavage/methylation domain-containing protein